MDGGDISVTHIALTGTRVMLTTGVIGQAAGFAAGMCINKNISPRGIYREHLTELQQQLLKEGAFLIEMPNKDPSDLALKAKVSASSELTPASEVINGFSRARLPNHFINADINLNAWLPDPKTKGPQWIQLSWDKSQEFNVVHVIFQNRGKLAAKNFVLEIKKNGNWEKLLNVDNPKASRRLVLPVGDIKSKAFRIVLNDENFSGGICEIRIYNEKPGLIETIKRANMTMNMPDEKVLLPWEK